MWNSTRRWLLGHALAVAVLGGLPLALLAQPGPIPPPTAPPAGAGGLSQPALGAGSATAVPTPRPEMTLRREGDLLRFSRHVPGDAKPISIDADEVYTWEENGLVVLLLKGQVLVQQSVAQTRFEQGTVWIDLKRYQATGILRLDLYAEGQVRLDTTLDGQEAKRALLDLETRGEFRLRAHRGKVTRQDRSADALVGRARALGIGPRLIQAGATRAPEAAPPTSAQPGPPPAPRMTPPPKSAPSPGTTGGLRPVSLKTPVRNGPGVAEFVLAQATEPVPTREVGTGSSGDPSPPRKLPPMPGSNGTIEPTDPPPPDPTPGESRRPANNDPEPRAPAIPPAPVPPSNPDSPPPDVPLPAQEAPAVEGDGGTGAPEVVPPRAVMPGQMPARQYRILPRSSEKFNVSRDPQPDGRDVITVTGGVILNVRNVPRLGDLDVEADRAVIWVKGGEKNKGIVSDLRSEQGSGSSELEFYMAGHVTVRVQSPGKNAKEKTVLETDEIYYDTNRNVAIAQNARLQIKTQRLAGAGGALNNEPIVMTAYQLLQTGPDTFEAKEAEVYSSKLISDPGLKLVVRDATIENRSRPKTNIFGQEVFDRKTGRPLTVEESILEARDVVAKLEGVPFFYTPYLITDARDPLGPLETIHLGGNRIFGFQAGLGLNVYKLLGIQPYDGTRWRLYADYLSRRGPGLGSTFTYTGKLFEYDPFDLDARPGFYNGEVKLYGIRDQATDILAGQPLENDFQPTGYRGRATWRQQLLDLPCGFDVVNQVSLLSDRNFLEEYYKREFDQAPNQANFLYVKQQQDNWAWSALGQARTSNWITTTEWLPRGDAYLLGQDLFGLFTSNTQVSAGYARLRPSYDPDPGLRGIPGPALPAYPFIQPTTQRVDTGRAALMQELSLPFTLGPFRVVPYVKGALVGYSNDLTGDEAGQAWGGGGLRASIPFTRIYPEACSELFNVNGLNHKIVLSGNYFIAGSRLPYGQLPQLDRLHDDATEQAMRDFRPFEPQFNPYAGVALATSRLYDPQAYAVRRLIDNRFDTLDDIQVLQVDLRQRLQTKRGFPGAEHIIDWMVLDTSVSYFPEANRDNFGKPFSFLEYSYLWNIGDQTSFESTGWYDPQIKGPRIFTVGMYFSRPDRTNFYIGYRQIDPLQSRMVTGAVSYVFSPKYSTTFSMSYDFGVQESVTNSLVFTRTGTDLQVSMGFTYNTLQNNFGAILEIVPNLVPGGRRANLANTQQGGLVGR